MPAMRQGLAASELISDDLRSLLRRRMSEIIGVALIAIAAAAGLALASWSVQDPSLSHATNAPIRNLLGSGGAIAADLMMQLFGIAAIAFILPVASWGWRLVTHRVLDRERWRLLLWIGGPARG